MRLPKGVTLIGRWLAADLRGERCYCPVGWLAHCAGVPEEDLLHKGAVSQEIAIAIAQYLQVGMDQDFLKRLRSLAVKADQPWSNQARHEMLGAFLAEENK